MNIYFDTEFIDLGTTILPLSIGMVREDGETYYAEPIETDRSRAGSWVCENVFPLLCGPLKATKEIANEIASFVQPHPIFWADFAAHDWVVLCSLFGSMMSLPKDWPMFVMDIRNLMLFNHRKDFPLFVGSEHHALDDAKMVKRIYEKWRQ